MLLIPAAAWAFLVAWLLLRAVRQFNAYRVLTVADGAAAGELSAVTLVVPARNEAANIGACAAGLVAQDYPGRLEIVLVDDDSTDGTGEIAARAFAGRDHYSLRKSAELPPGWTGKSHACWQGARHATGEWLCFLDADTRPAPRLLRTAVSWAEDNGVAMLSLEPEQELGSFWERIILPAGMFMMAFFTTDLRAINDPQSTAAAANGQFILIRRSLYEQIGGHAAVRGEISEDLALARRAKAASHQTLLLGSKGLVSVRMYRGLGEIWEGLSKNVVNQVGSLRQAGATATAGCLFAWTSLALPAVFSIVWLRQGMANAGAATLLTGLASLSLLFTHIAGARYFGVPAFYGLFFPLGYSMIGAIVFNSIRMYRRGTVRWKGRRYASQPEADKLREPTKLTADS